MWITTRNSIFFAAILPVFVILFGCSNSFSDATPPPPEAAKNIHFLKQTGWQKLSYFYRFDAPVFVCESFAKELMVYHQFSSSIKKEEYKRFPVKGDFPTWFDVNTVQNGFILTGDNRAYAVISVDPKSQMGRLYYYFSF